MTGSDAHKNDFAKTTAYFASFVQHGKGRGQKISAFNAQISGDRRFGCGGRVRGVFNARGVRGGRGGGRGRGKKTIFPPDNILTRSGRFLYTMRRARYLILTINLNHVISMRSIYWKHQPLRSPILRPDRTLVWPLKRRKRVPVIV